MLVLALESSTSSAKAMLYDTEAGPVLSASRRYDPSFSLDGASDTEAIFQLTMEMGRQVAEGKDVAAIGISSVWHTLAVLDSARRPVDKTYMWNYLVPSASCARARQDHALTDELYSRTGCVPHTTYVRQLLRYFRENGMDLSDKLFETQGAYTIRRLTGEPVETPNVMSGGGLINLRELKYDPFALEYAGIREDQLVPLGDYESVRPLSAAGAEMLGISPGIPVVPPFSDGSLNQIASAAAVVGRMTLSMGTSGAIRMTTAQPVLPSAHELWCYAGVVDYMSGAAINGACNCIDWFRDKFLGGRMSFAELDEGPEFSPDVPVFLPFLFGERNPGWRDDRIGGFLDVGPEHTSREMYRAVQMGVLFNLYQCYEALTREVGQPKEIYVSGGILNSPRWTQMLSDIFGTTMYSVNNRDASLVGASVLAMHAAGAQEDIRAFTRDIQGAAPVLPRDEYTNRYAALYQRYLELYSLTGTLTPPHQS